MKREAGKPANQNKRNKAFKQKQNCVSTARPTNKKKSGRCSLPISRTTTLTH